MRGVAARIAGQERLGAFLFVRFHSPPLAKRLRPGHFILVRLLPTWDPYLRVVLFPTALAPLSWLAYISPLQGTPRRILEHAPAGTPVTVYGPFGRPFPEPPAQSNVLIVTQEPYAPYVLGLVQVAANIANVVFLVERTGAGLPQDLTWLPPAVEFHQEEEPTRVEKRARDLAAWADYVYIAGPRHWPAYFARLLEQVWFTVRPGRAFAIVTDGMACGLGVCDSCVIEVRRGLTRACRKGPVFDVAEAAVGTIFGAAV